MTDHQITRSPDHPITRSPDHPISPPYSVELQRIAEIELDEIAIRFSAITRAVDRAFQHAGFTAPAEYKPES